MNKRNLKYIYLFLIGHLIMSCVPDARKVKSISSDDAVSTEDTGVPKSPSFPDTNNYFEYSSLKYKTTFSSTYTFDDNLFLRGEGIDSYLKNNMTSVTCNIFHFPNLPSGPTNLVVAGFSRNTINFTTNVKEYFYSLNFMTSNKSQNSAFCSNGSVNTYISTNFGGTIVYDMDDLCPTCSNNSYTSSPLKSVTVSASEPTSLNSTPLFLKTTYNSSSTSTGLCSTNSECTNVGLDCCLQGQCVKDGTLIKTYNSSEAQYTDYLSALLDVSNTPGNKKNYPQFYYVCGTNPTTPTPPDTTEEYTAQEKAMLLIKKMRHLYECTTPIDGEMSICTTTYSKANANQSPFYSGNDDLDFSTIYSGTLPFADTIHEILYQDDVIYQNGALVGTPGLTLFGTNDNQYDRMTINLTKAEDTNNKFKDLDIRYRIDGSCEKVNSSLAKCYKEYIQSQNLGKVTDHFPASNTYKIPIYADTSREIAVSVDGTTKQRIDISDLASYTSDINTWYLNLSAPSEVIFSYTNLSVQINQKVKISFYVDLNNFNMIQSKSIALSEIGGMCACPSNNCSLDPVYDTNNFVVNYVCKYPPPPTPEPPLQQSTSVSAKSVPNRHFDTTGTERIDLNANSLFTNPAYKQEGNEFKYTNGNYLLPNNISSYVGMSEIFGTFNYTVSSAQPAKLVNVKTGVTYDISSKNGNFQTCLNCGTDYYSNLLKIFPENLTYNAGGYKPYLTGSSKLSPLSTSIRADDLSYGRACFVPATMLPWSHKDNPTIKNQRLNRQKTQHFLYANGYNRDWYGFDYGSLIGSFDGVKWFSIGNQRRIKATSSKLYLAINAAFADLTTDSTFSVLIQDSIINGTNSFPTTDFESDGAQCQKAHVCSKDSDCASALGWDYACEEVNSIKSRYPSFDSNGVEMYNPTSPALQLLSLTGNYSGSTKRCVYRGRGVACTPDYSAVSSTSSYTTSTKARHHGCSTNSYCQEISNGTPPSVFNSKINRYGSSVKIRNAQSGATQVTSFGLLSPIIGRPFKYTGDEAIDLNVLSNLTANNVEGICLPGRDTTTSSTLEDIMQQIPTTRGDVVNNIGKTKSTNALTGLEAELYNLCPTFNTLGNYVHFDNPTLISSDATFSSLARAQNLSTRLLDRFDTLGAATSELTLDYSNQVASTVNLDKNSCLRAPGSSCFSDFDCAPSKNIANKLKSASESDIGTLNIYELLFWQEELVCAQPARPTESGFDVKNNRCCREIGKKITIPTVDSNNDIQHPTRIGKVNTTQIVGAQVSVESDERYSRNGTALGSGKTLNVATNDTCPGAGCLPITNLSEQYKALTQYAKRTCCSENWVREFQTNDIASGHEWKPEKFQKYNASNFKCLNYSDMALDDCTDPFDSTKCTSREIPKAEADTIMKWIANFELTGIPNIAITDPSTDANYQCEDTSSNTAIPGLVDGAAVAEYDNGGGGTFYLKGDDVTNFENNGTNIVKQIFSPDTFACCMPAGTQMTSTDTDAMCCTGYINPNNNRCALRNYNDITTYLNRYVSSEAQDLPDTRFDTTTGSLKDPSVVAQVACEKRLCASGYYAFGIAYNSYQYKNVADDQTFKNVNRFIEDLNYDNERGLADLYKAGLKWNDHLYCVPEDVANNLSAAGQVVYNCN